MGTVNLPVVGAVQSRWLYIGAGVVVVVVGGAWYLKARRGAQVTYDPATGSVNGSGLYTNPVPNPPDSGVPVETMPGIIDTNAEWSAAAVEALQNNGWDGQFASVAIGKYLAEQAVTKDEERAILAAWALVGKPPVNPPLIHLETSTSTPGGGSTQQPPAPKPGAAARRYMIRPGAATTHGADRIWIDFPVPGLYSGQTDQIPYDKSEKAPRRYRLVNNKHVWLDLPGSGRYNGDTQRVP
jgi:hypothetical protein